MNSYITPEIPCTVPGAQVLDGEHAAGDEAAQRDDRHGDVEIEDLLEEALVGILGRVEEDHRRREGESGGRSDRKDAQARGVHGEIYRSPRGLKTDADLAMLVAVSRHRSAHSDGSMVLRPT